MTLRSVPSPRRPDVPLGSVVDEVQRAHIIGKVRACPSCSSADLNVVRMTLTDATRVRFVVCNACAQTSWFAASGAQLPFDDVMRRASVRSA